MNYCPKTGKVMYATRGDVKPVERAVKRRRPDLRSYRCPECGAWHLGREVDERFRTKASGKLAR